MLLNRTLPGLLAAAALAAAPVRAQQAGDRPEPGHGSITTRLGIYGKSDDGGGNPFYDEDLAVVEPALILDYALDSQWRLGATFLYDYVSSASIERLSRKRYYPKTQQSGASGDFYVGGDVQAHYRQDDRNTWGGHIGYSREYDYGSLALGGDYEWRKPGGDGRLQASLESYLDSVHVIRWNGTSHGSAGRTSVAADLSWYQALGRSTHGSFGAVVSHQSGFLETAFNAVVLEDPSLPPNPALVGRVRGIETNEELPDTRLRTALYGRVRQLLSDRTSLELGGRFYRDDWGILAWDLDPRLTRELAADRLLGWLHYRYYDQNGADAYSDHFHGATAAAAPRYRTQDPELGPFHSQTVGLGLTWWGGAAWDFSLSLDVIFRSDGLDHYLAGFGWTWRF
ncbi:MAG: DUF3570 domain-containing protein [Planctomycetota bacterium]|nr:MAG: DUF3570 domain-containing protein [Planctomycetota bacterium]